VLYQLSYSHRRVDYSNCGWCCQRLAAARNRRRSWAEESRISAREWEETVSGPVQVMGAPGFALV
jgi:hypothetical protein